MREFDLLPQNFTCPQKIVGALAVAIVVFIPIGAYTESYQGENPLADLFIGFTIFAFIVGGLAGLFFKPRIGRLKAALSTAVWAASYALLFNFYAHVYPSPDSISFAIVILCIFLSVIPCIVVYHAFVKSHSKESEIDHP